MLLDCCNWLLNCFDGFCSSFFGSNYPDLVTFPLTDEAVETGIAPMQVFIPIMDSIASGMGTQKMNLSLDFTSAVKKQQMIKILAVKM